MSVTFHSVPTCRVGRVRTMTHTNAISLLSLEAASIASRTFPARTHSQQPRVPVVVYAVAPQGAPVAALERYCTNLALLNRIHQRDLWPDPTRPRTQPRAGTVQSAADCGSQALFPSPPWRIAAAMLCVWWTSPRGAPHTRSARGMVTAGAREADEP